MSGMGWWMLLSSLLWLGLLAVAVWALVRWVAYQTQRGASGALDRGTTGLSAQEILRQRFARGEIDSDTFERMRRQLETPQVEQRSPATYS